MESNFLVCWIDDNPKKYSIATRSEIADGNLRGLPDQQLIGRTLDMKWQRKYCRAEILASGSRAEMKVKLDEQTKLAVTEAMSQTNVHQNLPSIVYAKKTAPSCVNNLMVVNKKSRIDDTLSLVRVHQSDDEGSSPEIIDPKDTIIAQLQMELENERTAHENCKKELVNIRALYESILDGGSREIDIGGGISLKKDALSTLRTVSSTLNIFGRNLFRLMFGIHEVVGRSLMGRKCNALKGAEQHPGVDPRKRDAIIEYALTTFGRKPGTENYKLCLKDLKHSLSNLITEMNNDAKAAEQQIRNSDESVD